MSLTLAVNAQNDLYLGSDGGMARRRDLEAVMQACEHAARTILSEMVYATDKGLPNFEAVWTGAPNLPQFEAYLRRNILAVEGVERILELDATTQGNTLSYRALIQTVYGTGTLNG